MWCSRDAEMDSGLLERLTGHAAELPRASICTSKTEALEYSSCTEIGLYRFCTEVPSEQIDVMPQKQSNSPKDIQECRMPVLEPVQHDWLVAFHLQSRVFGTTRLPCIRIPSIVAYFSLSDITISIAWISPLSCVLASRKFYLLQRSDVQTTG